MSKLHRLKHSFTTGELSPLMAMRPDFDRFKNGCYKLRNMVSTAQGPAKRRPGFEFVYDLSSLGLDAANPQVRMIPFIFNELQAYSLIFFRHTDGSCRLVFGTDDGSGSPGLVIYEDPVPTECPPGTPIDTPPTAGDIVSLTFPDEWDIENFDYAQTADEIYFAQSGLKPHLLTRYSHVCWELSELTFTEQPDEWTDENGWPERVTFHEQRLVYAANKLRRNTVWLSRAGDFMSFGKNEPLQADDAITFTLDSGTQNRIQWIQSASALHIGTLGDEWSVTGAGGAPLSPKDFNIRAQRQTNHGSEPVKPLKIGIATLFIEHLGRTIQEYVYDYTYDSYKTSDISILAPHLTTDYSVKDWTYQQVPDSVVWAIRSDGKLLGLTYQREHKVVAWHAHNSQGHFRAITAIPGQIREDDVWAIVERTVAGKPAYLIERMAKTFNSSFVEDGRFLDSYSEYFGMPTSTLTGLDHLEGQTVSLLVDGAVHSDTTVVGGKVELNDEYANIVVGLSYTSEVWPVLMDVTLRDGTIIGRKQRIVNLDIDVYMSLGMWIGRWDSEDGESEEECPFRIPGDLTGQAVPPKTGIIHYTFKEGFDREAVYFLRQKQPLPFMVRGVVDTIEVFE